MNKKITVIFWSLELLLFTGFVIELLSGYGVKMNINAVVTFQSFSFIGTSVVCLGFISDAFRRLTKCLEHDKLGISTPQILTHIVTFASATTAILAIILAVFIGNKPNFLAETHLSEKI